MQCSKDHKAWKVTYQISNILSSNGASRLTIKIKLSFDCSTKLMNTLHKEQSAQSVKKHTSKYEIDNRSFYDILDLIWKNTDMHPCQTADVQEGGQRGVLWHSFQAVRPEPMWQHQKSGQHFRYLCMTEKEGMELGKECCPTYQVNIILWNLMKYGWNMGTKALIQDQMFNTYWMASCMTSCP